MVNVQGKNASRRSASLVPDLPPATLLTRVNVVDVSGGGRILRNRSVVLIEDTFAEVASAANRRRSVAGMKVIDAAGAYLMPGLACSAPYTLRFTDPLIFPMYLANGITLARFEQVHSASGATAKRVLAMWGSQVRRGALPGPRVAGVTERPYTIRTLASHLRPWMPSCPDGGSTPVELTADVRDTLRYIRCRPGDDPIQMPDGNRKQALQEMSRELDRLALSSGSRPSPAGYGCKAIDLLERAVARGITPAAAIRAAAASGNGTIDAMPIAPGERADAVLLEGNPLEDIRACRQVLGVIQSGRVYLQEDLAAVLNAARHQVHRYRLSCACIALHERDGTTRHTSRISSRRRGRPSLEAPPSAADHSSAALRTSGMP